MNNFEVGDRVEIRMHDYYGHQFGDIGEIKAILHTNCFLVFVEGREPWSVHRPYVAYTEDEICLVQDKESFYVIKCRVADGPKYAVTQNKELLDLSFVSGVRICGSEKAAFDHLKSSCLMYNILAVSSSKIVNSIFDL